jgi:hypothetical protein
MTGRTDDSWQAARHATEALRRSGGADLAASEQLAAAAAAVLASDTEAARVALAGAAEASQGNADLVPSQWLVAEAARLTGDRTGNS